MAINSIITHTRDLDAPLRVTALRHCLVSGDDQGDRFEVTVQRGGAPESVSGGSVVGYFLREADGATIPVPGTASGHVASIVLPEACYAVSGRFTLTVKVTVGSVRHAVAVFEGAVLRSATDAIIDPGHNIPDLQELLAMISQMETVTEEGRQATRNATAAATAAEDSAAKAKTAASGADTAAGKANTEATAANKAAAGAVAGEKAAREAAAEAKAAAGRVDSSIEEAAGAAREAHEAAGRVDEAIEAAAGAAGAAGDAAEAAREETARVAEAREGAEEALKAAEAVILAAGKWGNMAWSVSMLGPEEPPMIIVEDTETGKTAELRIPRGMTGLTPQLRIGTITPVDTIEEMDAQLSGTPEEPILNLWLARGLPGSIEGLVINGKSAESGDIQLTAEDVGARPEDWMPSPEEIGALPSEASGVKAGSYGPITHVAPGFGGTFVVPGFAVDEHGIVTASEDRIVTMPGVPESVSGSAGRLSIGAYSSFASAWAARPDGATTRVYRVNYNTTPDPYSPLPARTGDTWWNVFEMGEPSRCLQITSMAFVNRNVLYFRVRHDSTWWGWYALTGSTVSTASAAATDAGTIAFVRLAETGVIDAVTAGEHADVFDEWAAGVSCTVGQLRRYKDMLYRCLQAHTSQSDWTPDVTPALWELAADSIKR